jgi:hypothetical protein
VAAMRSMLAELGTEASKKREVAFPEAGDHVIASRIVSQDWQGVERASAVFLMEVAGMKEADRSK